MKRISDPLFDLKTKADLFAHLMKKMRALDTDDFRSARLGSGKDRTIDDYRTTLWFRTRPFEFLANKKFARLWNEDEIDDLKIVAIPS